ncbi:MAG: hypothetical protein K8823_2 [Cenarchaeum symbiont of Oopsacas minuta]|nr:hypothetical protein [Cenarchaeum symbiont of Oopsacas minuta]
MLGDKCSIPSSHEQFIHTHYDISQMLTNYHKPDIFRYNFNAFLQSLRNVTFLLQNELKHKEGFDAWYEHQREFMKQDNFLKKILIPQSISSFKKCIATFFDHLVYNNSCKSVMRISFRPITNAKIYA